VCFFVGKQMKFKQLINKKKPNWVIIASPNHTHFKITLKCLKENINVFCEKPLALSYKEAKYLYSIAQKKKLKLYCNDIENYKNKIKINNLKSNNYIIRKKNSKNYSNILERLSYHDFTYLCKFLDKKKIKINIIDYSVSKISFVINYYKQKFFFEYDLNAKIVEHKFNGLNLKNKKDYLNKMLISVINNKVNVSENKRVTLFSCYMIEKIRSKIKNYQ
jgi:hypothetical protein